ncbi:MAG: hypothetical protein KDC43_14485, partial [Saprospiraceae bacterium]|nr:hypothetical protein [Saprospiraceae bacterium]MCB0625078.1 hypothetical protein [Saprospiraceae bacterium]
MERDSLLCPYSSNQFAAKSIVKKHCIIEPIRRNKVLSEIILTVEGVDPVELYGENNAKLNLLKKAFPELSITARGNHLKLAGEKKYTQKAKSKVEMMVRMLKEQHELSLHAVEDLL